MPAKAKRAKLGESECEVRVGYPSQLICYKFSQKDQAVCAVHQMLVETQSMAKVDLIPVLPSLVHKNRTY